MTQFLHSEAFILALNFIVFFAAVWLQKKTKFILFNPILVTVTLLIAFLSLFKISYESYHEGSRIIEFFLKPAVVALGLPLYQQLGRIRKQAVAIIVSQLAGCVAGVVSVVLIAKGMGASKNVILSLAPKSVTTPIAIEISNTIGGVPSLTAAVVIIVGIFGAVFGYSLMKLLNVHNPIAQGLSMGTAAHGIGTSRSLQISENYGAYSSLGLIANGIFTAALAPYILKLLPI